MARKVQRLLANNALARSMGRSYGAGDNASTESFFSLLQKNVLNTGRWDAREELRLAIVTWIETRYDRRRRQRALGRLTPTEFEHDLQGRRSGLNSSTPRRQPKRGQTLRVHRSRTNCNQNCTTCLVSKGWMVVQSRPASL